MRLFQRVGFLETAKCPPSENLFFQCILRALIDKQAKTAVAEKDTVSLLLWSQILNQGRQTLSAQPLQLTNKQLGQVNRSGRGSGNGFHFPSPHYLLHWEMPKKLNFLRMNIQQILNSFQECCLDNYVLWNLWILSKNHCRYNPKLETKKIAS